MFGLFAADQCLTGEQEICKRIKAFVKQLEKDANQPAIPPFSDLFPRQPNTVQIDLEATLAQCGQGMDISICYSNGDLSNRDLSNSATTQAISGIFIFLIFLCL